MDKTSNATKPSKLLKTYYKADFSKELLQRVMSAHITLTYAEILEEIQKVEEIVSNISANQKEE